MPRGVRFDHTTDPAQHNQARDRRTEPISHQAGVQPSDPDTLHRAHNADRYDLAHHRTVPHAAERADAHHDHRQRPTRTPNGRLDDPQPSTG